jgi:tetratricopeptide (TPR) repeat protein
MRHLGWWEEAEQAARDACKDFEKSGIDGHAGEAFYELGLLAHNKGDFQEAEAAFLRAHEFGHDPVPGLPLLRLAQGNIAAAQQTIERALGESTNSRLRRAELLAAGTIISVASNDLTMADAAATELLKIATDFGCPAFRAHAMKGRGGLELERDNIDSATPALREAWSIFNDLGFCYEAARVRTILAEAYYKTGNHEDGALQLNAACKTFAELGAKADLAKVSELRDRLQ